jgi:hypothetical protein
MASPWARYDASGSYAHVKWWGDGAAMDSTNTYPYNLYRWSVQPTALSFNPFLGNLHSHRAVIAAILCQNDSVAHDYRQNL